MRKNTKWKMQQAHSGASRPLSILHSPFSILILSSLLSCTERMDISTGYAVPRPVITGYVTTDTAVHHIHISRTAPYFGSEEPATLSGALVTINDVPLTPAGNGDYLTDAAFHGISGATYRLDVWVDFDSDGHNEHYSAHTTMPDIHRLDSITLSPVFAYSPLPPWMPVVHFQDLPGPNHFGAHLYINGEQYSRQLDYYFLSNFGDYAAEGQYIRFPVMSYLIRKEMRWPGEQHFAVHPLDTVTIELNVLSKEYFDFVRTAQAELNGGNPLFAGPPANIPSNISGGALGVFGAYTISRQQLILPPEESW